MHYCMHLQYTTVELQRHYWNCAWFVASALYGVGVSGSGPVQVGAPKSGPGVPILPCCSVIAPPEKCAALRCSALLYHALRSTVFTINYYYTTIFARCSLVNGPDLFHLQATRYWSLLFALWHCLRETQTPKSNITIINIIFSFPSLHTSQFLCASNHFPLLTSW